MSWYQTGVPIGCGLSEGSAPSPDEFRLCGLEDYDFQAKSVLDVCCNTGYFALEAARRGASWVYGFDRDEQAISLAKDAQSIYGATEVFFTPLEFGEVPWKSLPRFDLVLAMSCIYHLSRDHAADMVLDRLCDACADKLALYTKVFTLRSEPEKLGEGWENLYIPTIQELMRELNERGFRVSHVSGGSTTCSRNECRKIAFRAMRIYR